MRKLLVVVPALFLFAVLAAQPRPAFRLEEATIATIDGGAA